MSYFSTRFALTISTAFLASVSLVACGNPSPKLSESDAILAESFDEQQLDLLTDVNAFCETVSEKYIYIDKLNGNWPIACNQAKDAIIDTNAGAERFRLLEDLLDALYEPHSMFGSNLPDSYRLIPSGIDFWIEGDQISAVLPNSAAAMAGVRVGDQIISANGTPLEELRVERLQPLGATYSDQQKNWSLISSAQGRRDTARRIVVMRGGEMLEIDIGDDINPSFDSTVDARMIYDNTAYLRLNNRLGDIQTVADFDAALETVKDAESWILDLRYTPGGGGTDIAVPIISRFVEGKIPYQITEYKNGKTWIAKTRSTKKWTAKGPMVVLVGRWTGSMGEGMAIGFDGMNRATVIGNNMAGLAGGVEDFEFPKFGVRYSFPTYNLKHVDGTNRHEWSPPIFVVSDNGNGSDLALEKALNILREQE